MPAGPTAPRARPPGSLRPQARPTSARHACGLPRPPGEGPGPAGCRAAGAAAAGQSKSSAGIICMRCARRGRAVATPTTSPAGRGPGRGAGHRLRPAPLQSQAPAGLRMPSPCLRTWPKPPLLRPRAPRLRLARLLKGAALKPTRTMLASKLLRREEGLGRKAGSMRWSLCRGSPTGAAGSTPAPARPCRAGSRRGSSSTWLWVRGSLRFAATLPWGNAFAGSTARTSTGRCATCAGCKPCTRWTRPSGQAT